MLKFPLNAKMKVAIWRRVYGQSQNRRSNGARVGWCILSSRQVEIDAHLTARKLFHNSVCSSFEYKNNNVLCIFNQDKY